MESNGTSAARTALIWAGLGIALTVPLVASAMSPLLAWRSPVYIVAGFAGVVGLGLLLVQPLLIGGYLPGLSAARRRRLHRFVGMGLVVAVIVHVGGLWITSPPDVVDALLFVSPTPFSPWGVISMWTLFAVALWAALRKRLNVLPRTWRTIHASLAMVIVVGTVVHAVLIEGTMETFSKLVLCGLVLLATVRTMATLRVWRRRSLSKNG